MANNPDATTNLSQPAIYQIRLKGHLGVQWADWFEGLAITLAEDGETLLTGPVVTRLRCMGCSRKCVISACHWSRSVLSNPGFRLRSPFGNSTGLARLMRQMSSRESA